MIGYIDADNTASLGIHERFGFVRVGLLPVVALLGSARMGTALDQARTAMDALAAALPRLLEQAIAGTADPMTLARLWLADPALSHIVAGISPAHARHGGSGALYVALKRRG